MAIRKERYADMEKFNKTRKNQRKRYYQKTQMYKGRPWSQDEERLVLEHKIPDSELSRKIKRSVGAIQTRRRVLKKLM